MKYLLIVTFLICAISSARADQLGHEAVVRTLISAAQKDQLQRFLTTTDLPRIAGHPKHGHSSEALLDLLKKIPSGDFKFEVQHDASTKSTLVRLVSPTRLDFTLERRGPYADEDEDRFVVVSVTPKDSDRRTSRGIRRAISFPVSFHSLPQLRPRVRFRRSLEIEEDDGSRSWIRQ